MVFLILIADTNPLPHIGSIEDVTFRIIPSLNRSQGARQAGPSAMSRVNRAMLEEWRRRINDETVSVRKILGNAAESYSPGTNRNIRLSVRCVAMTAKAPPVCDLSPWQGQWRAGRALARASVCHTSWSWTTTTSCAG
jgi:hypothetical protein